MKEGPLANYFANKKNLLKPLLIVALSVLMACSSLNDPYYRTLSAEKLASESGWVPRVIETDYFDLYAYTKPFAEIEGKPLYLYIEGDGFAWRSKSSPSFNPTPINPLALKLALRHVEVSAAYLARPCQYTTGKQRRNCDQKYWTDFRFSNEVVVAMGQAADALKQDYGANKLVLVGYSGGGAIAALLAAQRTDVVGLITVAGNLDHREWTEYQRITPLSGSMNPADYWEKLQDIPQLHFLGTGDRVIPESVAISFRNRFKNAENIKLITVEGNSHSCCWEKDWPKILN